MSSEYIKNSLSSTQGKQQKMRKKFWTDISPKKINGWQKSIWKYIQRDQSLGNGNKTTIGYPLTPIRIAKLNKRTRAVIIT